MKMNPLIALGFGLATTTMACAAGTTVGSGAQGLVEQCAGTYTCVDGDGGVGAPSLHKDGDVCMMNSNLTLNADGTVLLSGQATDATWSGDSQSFVYCQLPNDCATCTPQATTADAGGGAGGKCTGSTYGCEEQSPSYCSNVSGCYMATKIGPNNSFENYCAGYADPCDEMSTEASCKEQGCTWKP